MKIVQDFLDIQYVRMIFIYDRFDTGVSVRVIGYMIYDIGNGLNIQLVYNLYLVLPLNHFGLGVTMLGNGMGN